MDYDGSDPKRGRVRKKSAKVREMEEFEEEERKHGTKRGSEVKSPEGVSGLTSPPLKKVKVKQDPGTPVNTVTTTPPKTPTSPSADPQARGSVIKLLLSSPVQQSTPAVTGKAGKRNTNEPAEDVSPVLASTKKTAKAKKAGVGDTDDKNLKLKFHLGASPSVEPSVEKKAKGSEKLAPLSVDTTVQSEAIGEEGSLKMKFILSPKEKTSEPTCIPTGSVKRAVNIEKADNQGLLSILKGASAALVGKKPRKSKTDSESDTPTGTGSKVKSSEKGKLPGDGSAEKTTKSGVKRKIEQTVVVKTNPSSSVEYSLPADHSLEYMDLSSFDFDDDGELVIAEENKTKKLKKTGSKSPKKAKALPTAPLPTTTITPTENEFSLDDSQLVSSDVAELAKRVKTAAEKKLTKKVKKVKPEKEEVPGKEKKKRPPTAYMLWCNSYRHKVVAEIPGADFVQISKRLGELWQALPDKEKLSWKNKAKKNAGKGSTLISTGKTGGSRTGPPPQITSHNQTSAVPSTPTVKTLVPVNSKPKPSPDDPLSPIKGFGTEPVDVAAHLKLVGESLCIIGVRLQEHRGLIAVQGSLSVLLDSMLCACGPLMCLTQQLPELNGCPSQVHAKTLDNVAYIMPGL